jgi:tetraacyldisaccharide 4'-kinase
MANWLQKQWTGYSVWHLILLPLSMLFLCLAFIRKCLFKVGFLRRVKLPIPVIVIGNITVGGTGKTPLVIWLSSVLRQAGFHPGIVSRGYGGEHQSPSEVLADSMPEAVGDEPILIAKRTDSPIFVGVDRVQAAFALLTAHPEIDILISDDGLQHHHLERDIEIVVVDGQRKFGNALLLPAGPLRESVNRLNSVDAVVLTASANLPFLDHKISPPIYSMELRGDRFFSLMDAEIERTADFFKGKPLVAVAGIGNPGRFYQTLAELNLVFERHSFPDHHMFTPQDLDSFLDKTILMTEKDAVKCAKFAKHNAKFDIWVLPVSAMIDADLTELILQKLAVSFVQK